MISVAAQSPPLPGGTITFLFTDIEGSTRLWEHAPDAMRAALTRHDDLLRACIAEGGGRVFKTVGDAFCAVFPSANEALAAAAAAQRALRNEPWPEAAVIRVRMALHTGVAEERDGDYFGAALSRISRLLAVGHGGQTLLSATTQTLVQSNLPSDVRLEDLGVHHLKDLSQPERVYQLHLPDLPNEYPPLRSLENHPNNLPPQFTSFVGRAREIAAVQDLLKKTRLLTLVGAGGAGKTRLALQVAVERLDDYPDGIWLVELASLTDPALIPLSVAAALGAREEPGRSMSDTLVRYLKEKRLLLLLDNCEHLITASAQLTDTLLRAAPGLTVMTTSREPLNIHGETVYRVPSLSLPSLGRSGATATPEGLVKYESVRLFVERAVAVRPDFSVTPSNASAVAQVCHRLDGIPLAIELAAARVRVLPVEQINTRLNDRFRLLTGGSRTSLPRQQTLRALIDWSYDLLSDAERTLFCRLAVFVGGGTLEAVEQVGASVEYWVPGTGGKDSSLTPDTQYPTPISPEDVLDLLTGLVDKSLVLVEGEAGHTTYRLLETVRQYAMERLIERGESEAVRRRHRDWFLSLAETAAPNLRGPEAGIWLTRLEKENDNLRTALESSLTDPEGAQTGLRLAGEMAGFWAMCGYLTEGRKRIAPILARPEAQSPSTPRAKALRGAGILAHLQGDLDEARSLYEKSLDIYQQLDDRSGLARLYNSLGNVAQLQGDLSSAAHWFEEGLALARELGDRQITAFVLGNRGYVAFLQGEPSQAKTWFEQALSVFQELGDQDSVAASLTNLGGVAYHQGDYPEAARRLEESLAVSSRLGDKLPLRGDTLRIRGAVALKQDDLSKAWAYLQEGLELCRELGDRRQAAALLEVRARLARAEGNSEQAVRLLGAAEALREAIGMPVEAADRAEYDADVAEMRSALPESRFQTCWMAGREMSWEQAVAAALQSADSR